MKIKPSLRSFLAVSSSALLAASSAHADTYYWDTDDTTSGFGNIAGTWGSSAFWSTNAAGTATTANTLITSSDAVNFGTSTLALGSTAATIAVDAGGVTVNSMTFGSAQSSAVTLSGGGGSITLAGTTPTITVNNASNTIGAVLTGSAGMTKAGNGTLVLTGANTYTGATNINAGTLQVSNTGAIPATSAVNLTASGAKMVLGTPGQALSWGASSAVADSEYPYNGAFIVNNAIDGDTGTRWASDVADNAGVDHWIYADLGTAQNLSKFTINWEGAYSTAFTLQVSNDASTWTTASATFNAGGAGLKTYDFNANTNGRYARVYSDTGLYSLISIWEMQAYGTASGAGTYSIGSLAGATGSIVDLQGIGSTLKAGSDNTTTAFAGTLVGGASDTFVKEGSGDLTLSANHSAFTGAISVTGTGKLIVSNTLGESQGISAASSVSVASGATLEIGGTGNNKLPSGPGKTWTVAGTLNNNATAPGNVMSMAGTVVLNGGTLSSTSAGGSGFGAFHAFGTTITANGTGNTISSVDLSIARNFASLVLDTPLAGDTLNASTNFKNAGTGTAAGITKNGLGTVTLSGTNSYEGPTTVSNGTLLIDGSTSTSSTVNVNGGTLGGTGAIGGSVNVNNGASLSPGAGIQSLATGLLTMTTGSTFAYEVADNTGMGADLLAANGMVSLAGVTLSLDAATLAALSGGGWSIGNKLTLMSYFHAGSGITSGFTGYADDTSYLFGTNQWMFDYNDTQAGGNFGTDAIASGQNQFVTMTLVPEPRAALLGGLGLLALLRRRRN